MKDQTRDNTAVIIGYCRTAFAKTSPKKPGFFSDLNPVNMQVPLVNALLDRTGLDPQHVKKVITGAVHQEADQGLNIARLLVLHKDCHLLDTTAGTTLDMFCASSMEAIAMADGQIARHPDSVYIVTGVQSMSHIPMGGLNPELSEKVESGNVAGFMNMPITAENLAEIYNVSRLEQDRFSLGSHKKLAAAQEAGYLKNEIVPLEGLDYDDGVRSDTSMEGLARLRTVAKDGGTVTAGNASQVTDGASAMMLTSQAFATKNNLPVMARIIGTGETGVAPEIMGIGPVKASINALKHAGITMNDIGAIELNEAFAAQSLAVLKEWDVRGMAVDRDKVNIDGGAIAMGHPLGATGARLVGHLAEIMNRQNLQYGLATLCIGGGQGKAVVLENPNFVPEKPAM
ncbi:MAG: acetyl-CoA C-acyltransferase [Alphaproteobacteria bacterium CG_4_9_14_3_um_filter_47_13]|nr:MAG: acetyl-CoA C-acyltransferase [Alphaproteobacteria bacterium CG_4_9_14_3_um_filter_47_13]